MSHLLEALRTAQQQQATAPDTPALLYPPLNFALVVPGVYRCGHPNSGNFPHLESLNLRSIMYLCTDDYRHDTRTWAEEQGLNVFHLRLDVSKDPTVEVDEGMVKEALEKVLDSRNLPILIHDNKGRIVPSIISSILRLMCGWTLDAALHEYRLFLPPTEDWVPEELKPKKAKKDKERVADLHFIDRFPIDSLEYDPQYAPVWLNR
ncbi:hypothetical protein JCM10207_007468 [Rhodosporidiobolus poonsookiae]